MRRLENLAERAAGDVRHVEFDLGRWIAVRHKYRGRTCDWGNYDITLLSSGHLVPRTRSLAPIHHVGPGIQSRRIALVYLMSKGDQAEDVAPHADN